MSTSHTELSRESVQEKEKVALSRSQSAAEKWVQSEVITAHEADIYLDQKKLHQITYLWVGGEEFYNFIFEFHHYSVGQADITFNKKLNLITSFK